MCGIENVYQTNPQSAIRKRIPIHYRAAVIFKWTTMPAVCFLQCPMTTSIEKKVGQNRTISN